MGFQNLFFLNKNQSLWCLHNLPLVKPSFWPFCLAMIVGCSLFFQIIWWYDFTSFSMWIQHFKWTFTEFHFVLLGCSFLWLLLMSYYWLNDLTWDFNMQRDYLSEYFKMFKGAFILFLLSEMFFFVGIFWAFFHSSLHSTWILGELWPPVGVIIISSYTFPLFNTLLLLSSGFFFSNGILALHNNSTMKMGFNFLITPLLGMFFTYIQVQEYILCSFTFNDSVYGSVFFFATGTHGLHVLLGTMFLWIVYFRFYFNSELLGINIILPTLAGWYWHFVDIVWIFLYLFVYFWGNYTESYIPFIFF